MCVCRYAEGRLASVKMIYLFFCTCPSPNNTAAPLGAASRLTSAGIPARAEVREDRHLDHGAWMPLTLAFPKVDVPVIQISLLASLDPSTHCRLGQELSFLRAHGVLVSALSRLLTSIRVWDFRSQHHRSTHGIRAHHTHACMHALSTVCTLQCLFVFLLPVKGMVGWFILRFLFGDNIRSHACCRRKCEQRIRSTAVGLSVGRFLLLFLFLWIVQPGG